VTYIKGEQRMKIGCHVSNNGSSMLYGAVLEALSYDATAFMIYTGAPQNTFRKKVNEMQIDEMKQVMLDKGLSFYDVVVHAPYIVNLAQPDPEKRQFAVDFLTNEVKITAAIGAKSMVLHPGAHVGGGIEQGITLIAEGINKIIANTKGLDVVIALETMAGKGTEVGSRFEEIKAIIDLIEDQSRIGVCMDSCHINDAGYDIVNHYEDVLQEFNQIVGFDKLRVIHVNDSKNILGARKDRHENIGFGTLGFDTVVQFFYDSRFNHIPKILETPYVDGDNGQSYPPYYHEIKMIKEKQFDPTILEKIKDQNRL
jgi:deoxyribonuclease IV